MNDLSGKIALVTGGSRGIGRAVVKRLAGAGARVAFSYLKSAGEARALADEITGQGGEALTFQADVSDEAQAKALCQAVADKWGPPDVLVNNAGITKDKSFMMMTTDEWRDVLSLDLDGFYYVTRSSIFLMLKRRSGTIINMASISGLTGRAGQANYSAAKAGIIGLTKALAREVGPFGLRVNAVAPGFIETDMLSAMNEKVRKEEIGQIPLRRFGQPEEVADMVLFLASDASKYVTGQVFVVDGGASL